MEIGGRVKKGLRLLVGLLLAGSALAGTGLAEAAGLSLKAGFASPPDDAKLQVWWHWLTKSTTKKGVEADLKAMKEMEISTAHVFVPGFSGMPDRTGKILTPEWMDVFKYAIERANHYGIKLGFHNCPGWSASGGPWITADNSMQVLAASALDTELASGRLKLPDPPRKGFYEDVAVFAFPADAKADVAKVTSDFGGDVEGFKAGRATLAPPVAKGEKGGTVTVEYAAPVKARFIALEFDGRHLFVGLTVEGTADGQTWKRLGGVRWEVYLSPRGARYIELKGLNALKAVRVRFDHVDAPGYADNKVVLSSVALTDLPMIAGIETLNCAKSFGAYSPGKGEGLARSDIHDVTAKLSKDGTLDWTAPGPGRWRILRLGRASTGKFNSPADVVGYECDKLSKRGLAAHWPHMPRVFAGLPGAKDAITTCIIDSFEAGGQNWTKDMVAEFRRRRGYDPTPYLPVIVGYAVGSRDDSHKFLEDFRRTVSDLFAENYYDYFAELCHREGWLAATEAYGGNYDGKRCWRKADIPMHEFWIEWEPGGIAGSASAAHFNGAKYVGAESFTSWPEKGRWQITPRQLREVGDPQWVNGLNSIIVHSYLQQPYLNVVPGASLGHHGSQFNRNLTWWKEGVAWSRYVARGQFLLQSGRPCAEVLAFDGTGHLQNLLNAGYVYDTCSVDDLARLANGPDGSLVAPSGMRYEMLFLGDRRHWPLRQLRELRRLADGGARIAGNRPLGTNSLADDPEEWKRECEAFWQGHANVKSCGLAVPAAKLFGIRAPFDAHGFLRHLRRDVGGLPLYFVANLTDADYCATTTFAAPAGSVPELWDAADGSRRAVPTVAGGRADEARIVLDVPAHRSVFVVFRPGARDESAADVPLVPSKVTVVSASYGAADGSRPARDVRAAVARQVASDGAICAQNGLLDGDPAPGIPKKLAVEYVQDGVTVKKTLAEFSTLKVGTCMSAPRPLGKTVADLSTDWTITAFDGKCPPSAPVRMEKLASWSESGDEKLKYFSGHATYEKTVEKLGVEKLRCGAGGRLVLDLGDVRDVANVYVDGKFVACLWSAPYEVDVTDFLTAGHHALRVEVVNGWPNRMIGDALARKRGAAEPKEGYFPKWVLEDRPDSGTGIYTWANWLEGWKAEDSPLPAGLLGPVVLWSRSAKCALETGN